MYRIQRFDDRTTGLHMQIGKGGGFHLAEAEQRSQKLPVTITVGGPPALILAAIAPLPENVPEVLLASLVQGSKLNVLRPSDCKLPIFSEAEFVLSGEVFPHERRLEGPFGDHYGYYSLAHEFPVFHCTKLFHREDAIYPATVVGKPKQEDFFIGDYLQELLSPLFPLVMPGVVDLWSYGETGYHSLSAAVVKERYHREALASAFRILGEGQLSLTKFLFLTDRKVDLRDFKSLLVTVLERSDLRTDLYIFPNTSMDTLDYGGPELNKGSKGVLLGCGEVKRRLPELFCENPPAGIDVQVFCPGCLVVSGPSYQDAPDLGSQLVKLGCFSGWPLIVLVDNAKSCAEISSAFLWQVFTKFEPARDIYSAAESLRANQILRTPPILIDSRRKTWYPDEVEVDVETKNLVDRRWREYGLS
jgi:3-polyprenyl-4-hydroxybenzoate decarboxylase